MANEIERQIASLPSEVIADNKVSWERVISQIEDAVERGSSKYWTVSKLDAIREFAEMEESLLFRVGISRVYLTFSTAQKVGLERGELFLRLIWNEDNLPVLEYCKFGRKSVQAYPCKRERDLQSTLRPLLKRLWYETRDKREAKQEE